MEKRVITDSKGREIELRCEIEGTLISAYHESLQIGEFEFSYQEGPMQGEYFMLVTHMFLDKAPGFKRCGIGTEIIRWAEELNEATVIFGRDDGIKTHDGAYLIEDGPYFARGIADKRQQGIL